MLANTDKGKRLLASLKDDIQIREIPKDAFLDIYQKSGTPVVRPTSRDTFFELANNCSVRYAAERLCRLKEAVIDEARKTMVKMGVYDRLRRLKKGIYRNGEE